MNDVVRRLHLLLELLLQKIVIGLQTCVRIDTELVIRLQAFHVGLSLLDLVLPVIVNVLQLDVSLFDGLLQLDDHRLHVNLLSRLGVRFFLHFFEYLLVLFFVGVSLLIRYSDLLILHLDSLLQILDVSLNC